MSKNIIILLLISFNLVANDSVSPKKWQASKAAAIQQQAQLDELNLNTKKLPAQTIENKRNKFFQEQTGEGLPAHPEKTKEDIQQEVIQELISDIRANAKRIAVNSKEPLYEIVNKLHNDMKIISKGSNTSTSNKSLQIETIKGSPIIGGGEVYIYDATTSAYLGYAKISHNSMVSLPVIDKQLLDLVIIPTAPLPLQIITGFAPFATDKILIEEGVEVLINLENQGRKVTNTTADLYLQLTTKYGIFDQLAGTITGSGSVLIAKSESYRLDVRSQDQYVTQHIKNLTSNKAAITLELTTGVDFAINFTDTNNLVGIDECYLAAYIEIINDYTSEIYSGTYITDNQDALIGYNSVVPLHQTFSINIHFTPNGLPDNTCNIEDYRSRYNWVGATDQSIEVELKPRPIANIIYQTPDKQPIEYNYGSVYELNQDDSSLQYFSSVSLPNLEAGKTYAVNVQLIDPLYSLNEITLTAVAGEFDVVVESEELASITTAINIAGATNVEALIEFYRDGNLIEAFEYNQYRDETDIEVLIPAGDYTVNLSGITATWQREEDVDQSYLVVIQPFSEQATITISENQRLDFEISLPTKGIDLVFPQNLSSWSFYHMTIIKSDVATAAKFIGSWYKGIVSDYSSFDLKLRSSDGFHDQLIPITLSTPLNKLNLTELQDASGRLRGLVKDSNNTAVTDAPIFLYQENSTRREYHGTTDADGRFDVPKVKSGLLSISAKAEGNSLKYYYDIVDATIDTDLDITLEDLSFHTVTSTTEEPQLFYGSGSSDGNTGLNVVFLAESYTSVSETFTDANDNGVWDGVLFYDYNNNGVWDASDPYEDYKTFGNRTVDEDKEVGTNISLSNEAFIDSNGDGYLSINDFEVFVQNSKDYMRALLAYPFIKDNIDFNAYILFKSSNQVGTDILEDDGETYFLEVDTSFGAVYKKYRWLLGVNYDEVSAYVDSYLPDNDIKIVMINQPINVGRANGFILSNGGIGNLSPNASTPAHEVAHNPGGLADEYTEFRSTNMYYYRPDHNMTQRHDTTTIPWADLITDDIALPVSLPNSMGTGIFAGGGYYPGGAYRSTSTSMMRSGVPKLNDISEKIFEFNVCKAQLSQADLSANPASTAAPQYGQLENICRTSKPQPGLYYDRGRSGHGFVVEPIANTDLYYTIFYSYKDDGTPEWYTSLSTLENNVLNVNMDDDTLLRFIYDYSVSPIGSGNPNTVDTSIGTNKLKIDFNSSTVASSVACNDGVNRSENVALASWQLGNQTGDWCIEPLIAADNYPTPDFAGTWWAGSDDTGWGLSLSFAGDLIVVTIYYFDADGNPRWVQGTQSGFVIGQEITLEMLEFAGFARDATPVAVTNVIAGTLSLTLNNNNGDENDGVLNMNVTYQGAEGGTWSRTNIPVKIFTEPH